MTNGTKLRPLPFRTDGTHNGPGDVTGTTFYVYPGAYNTTKLDLVQFFLYLTTETVSDVPTCEAAIGVQLSHDGNDWPTDADSLGILDAFNGTADWLSENGRTDLPTLAALLDSFEHRANSGSGDPMDKLKAFCRFGIFVRNADGLSQPRGGTFALGVIPRLIEGGTVSGGPVLCPSGGGSEFLYTPVTRTLKSEEMTEFRVTLNIESNTGVRMVIVRFESDDDVTWDEPDYLVEGGDAIFYSDHGLTYGTAFLAGNGTLTKPFVRIGVGVVNLTTADDDYHSAMVGLKVDWRKG